MNGLVSMGRTRAAVLAFAVAAFAGSGAGAQGLVDWTEGPGTLGLGYPVPVPVDATAPFDGFRSYDGLHARHQELDIAHDAIQSEAIGQTVLGRDIWLYAFGSPDRPDAEGRQRPAILINGGIHAREWQSPEVVTGLMELLADGQNDRHLVDYLRDNTSILMIPVLNIDGFLQTQRYPRSNYLGTDPGNPAGSPRDGRMRRKNHRGADEDLFSAGDHLNGVDLNRNSLPFWAGGADTANPGGLVYRGSGAASEPEIQALQRAGARAPAGALRFYSDMHSFGKVLLAVDTGNGRRRQIQSDVLGMAIRHHEALPGAKRYREIIEQPGTGIGTTSEYFAHIFKVPSLTWELEPTSGAVEYGGFGTNGHDGFILPESQIRRVRDNMAFTLAAVAYHMAGPPHLARVHVFDADADALIADRRWRLSDGATRIRSARDIGGLQFGKAYDLWLAFDKPMRWRTDAGDLTTFPGQDALPLDIELQLLIGDTPLDIERGPARWHGSDGAGMTGFWRYRDDAASVRVTVRDTPANRALVANGSEATLSVEARDMTGRRLDGNPASAVDFANGAWTGYENAEGVAGDIGGADRTTNLPVVPTAQPAVFPIDPGHSATWYDTARNGEGFVLENHDGRSALLYWFTYDEAGRQRWLTATGDIRGNRIDFQDLVETTGGRFGPQFDPAAVIRRAVGSGRIWFRDCDSGWFDYDAFGQRGTFDLSRTSRTMGVDCDPGAPPGQPEAAQSGSWFDPDHNGEGYALQWMTGGDVIMTWYSFDPDGQPYWMLGVGSPDGDEIVFPDVHATRGGRFGAGFDPDAVERFLWGEVRMRLGCDTGEATYASVLPAFGSGRFDLQRLTGLAGLGCEDDP
jgi:hypothetical protein